MLENKILSQELSKYNLNNLFDIKNSLREITQKIILCGLERGGIFSYCAFYGGTSLRIFHNLDRFSEDLDFVLIKDSPSFDFDSYLKSGINELKSMGINSVYSIKDKNIETSVITGYIKFNLFETLNTLSLCKNININKEENISIKVEIETKYSLGYTLEYKRLLFPTYQKVLSFDLSTLFSCKLVAILRRNWKTRIKGRDYYDFLFYICNGIKPNYSYLKNALNDETLDKEKLLYLLKDKFENVDFISAKLDVKPFIDINNRFYSMFEKDIFIDLLSEL